MGLGDIVEVTFAASGPEGELLLNRLHFKQVTGFGDCTALEAPALATAFDAAIVPDLNNVRSNSSPYGQTAVKWLTGGSAGFQGVSVVSGGLAGNTSGIDGPIERCIVLRKHTGQSGRKFQGRMFLPMPCREAFLNGGTYDPTNPDGSTVAALQASLVASINGVCGGIASTFQLVIFHAGTITSTLVLAMNVSALVGIQRRRRVGVGV
jgi:hypothetical protein